MRRLRARSTTPALGSSAPAMTSSTDVFPAPLAPTTASRSRASMRRVIPRTMTSAP